MTRRKVTSGTRVRAYDVMARAVEEGVVCGLSRAHKHTEKPSQAAIAESVEREVMSAICEVFAFEEVGDG